LGRPWWAELIAELYAVPRIQKKAGPMNWVSWKSAGPSNWAPAKEAASSNWAAPKPEARSRPCR